jgi:hypothetical protein
MSQHGAFDHGVVMCGGSFFQRGHPPLSAAIWWIQSYLGGEGHEDRLLDGEGGLVGALDLLPALAVQGHEEVPVEAPLLLGLRLRHGGLERDGRRQRGRELMGRIEPGRGSRPPRRNRHVQGRREVLRANAQWFASGLFDRLENFHLLWLRVAFG